jgi:hypothetical protein
MDKADNMLEHMLLLMWRESVWLFFFVFLFFSFFCFFLFFFFFFLFFFWVVFVFFVEPALLLRNRADCVAIRARNYVNL